MSFYNKTFERTQNIGGRVMRVLFITNIPSPYRVDFFNELGKYVELTVLFERQSAKDREKIWHAHEFKNFLGSFLKGIKIGNDAAFCPAIIKYLSREKFDIIVVGGYSSPTYMLAMLYMKVKKLPFVLNSDGGFIREESKMKKSIKKFLISSATWWICSGKFTKETLKHYGADEERTFIYPFTSIRQEDILEKLPSIEEKRLLKKELNIVEEKVILSVGQFIPRKGFDLLIKASKSIPDDVGVYIVGGKPTEEYIELVEKLNLKKKVHFIDFKPKHEIRKYYMAADLFVQCEKTFGGSL